MVSKGGYKRASMEGVAPVPRGYVAGLLKRVDKTEYGTRVGGGLTPLEQRMRNKALISLLYLSARRISELVGRTCTTKKGKTLKWEGVRVRNFTRMEIAGRQVLVMRTQILKKSKVYLADTILSMGDEPFISHVLKWINYLGDRHGEDAKLFEVNRSRCFQIVKQLDPKINDHWFRHMRLSHLAEYLNPYQLTKRIGFWESINPAVSYVHGRVGDYLEALEKSRG